MLISDSMPQLWLIYLVLSLVVLVTGHLGIRFLPRLPRWLVTGLVAGIIWMPGRYSLPLPDQDEPYVGMAPAVVMAAVAFLQGDGAGLAMASVLLMIGGGIGAALGVLVWHRSRRRGDSRPAERRQDGGKGKPATSGERREPVIG